MTEQEQEQAYAALQAWMETGAYLPDCLKDFHDQKEIFKAIHERITDSDVMRRVNWIDGQIYVIDIFLWFMAKRGYTLQRTRTKKVKFIDLQSTLDLQNKKRLDALNAIFKQTGEQT